MKKKLLALVMAALTLTACTAKETAADTHIEVKTKSGYAVISFPDLRIDKGTYYDYMVVETSDGNEWLLGNEPNSHYLNENGNAIFKDGESVVVLFDTMGTDDITDDIVLNVKANKEVRK